MDLYSLILDTVEIGVDVDSLFWLGVSEDEVVEGDEMVELARMPVESPHGKAVLAILPVL